MRRVLHIVRVILTVVATYRGLDAKLLGRHPGFVSLLAAFFTGVDDVAVFVDRVAVFVDAAFLGRFLVEAVCLVLRLRQLAHRLCDRFLGTEDTEQRFFLLLVRSFVHRLAQHGRDLSRVRCVLVTSVLGDRTNDAVTYRCGVGVLHRRHLHNLGSHAGFVVANQTLLERQLRRALDHLRGFVLVLLDQGLRDEDIAIDILETTGHPAEDADRHLTLCGIRLVAGRLQQLLSDTLLAPDVGCGFELRTWRVLELQVLAREHRLADLRSLGLRRSVTC